MENQLKKYEVRFNDVNNHPTFIMAYDEGNAIARAVQQHNENTQRSNYVNASQIALVEQTSKVPLCEVAKPFTRTPSSKTNVSLPYLVEHLKHLGAYAEFVMEPKFQRAHVWTSEQQVLFVEFLLRHGKSGKDIYLNRYPDTDENTLGKTVLVDGLQRLTAIQRFLADDMIVFGKYNVNSFEYLHSIDLNFHINNLKTEREVMQWYLEMNAQGTPHTKEELDKVRDMLNG